MPLRTGGSSQGSAESAGGRSSSCVRPRRRGLQALRVASRALRGQRGGRRHRAARVTAPLFVLGVSRSGTTLLRVVLDRSPGIAIPDESFFIPLLARRHRGDGRSRALPRRPAADFRRSRRGVSRSTTSPRACARGCASGEAIAAIYETYAASERQAALGGQDADVHAPPTAARAPLPGRAVRPPDPRRARRCALVPAHARRERSRGPGLIRTQPPSSPACGAPRSPRHASWGTGSGRLGISRFGTRI